MSANYRTNDHTALKARILRVVDAPDGELLWQSLVELGFLDDYEFDARRDEAAEAEARSILENKARQLARDQRRLLDRNAGGRRREEVPVAVSEHEERMAAAYSALLAREAADDPLVRAFRDRELGGRLLSAEELEEYRRDAYRRALLTNYDGSVSTDPARVAAVEDLVRGHVPSLITGQTQPPWSLEADHTLGDVAGYLVHRYPWEPEAAATFVLTGETPDVKPLKLEYDPNRDTYTLKIRPWTSKAALGAAHRAIHGEESTRPLESNTLALLEFVDEHTAASPDGTRPTWEALMRAWNERGPGRPYKDYRTFSKRVREARKLLAPRRL